jgi:DNA helicase-2/ATP-dependent DNA helicase PcrA
LQSTSAILLDPGSTDFYAEALMGTSNLNASQLAAVKTLEGPLLVLAGAGTGKTRVITYRIAELIRTGTTPSRILAVTFTNKAAREMRERATRLLGRRKKNTKPPEISTFHSLAVRILRRHIDRLGYPKQFVIYDRGDQESVARAALRDIRVGHEKLRPGDVIGLISAWKGLSIRPEQAAQVAESDRQQLAALAYVRYQAALKTAGAVDFDDLLLCTEELLEGFPEVRYAEASRFDHLLIDEYQDTNGLQYRIVRALAQHHGNLCVVGDDDQSIYGWRGAEVSHILGFERDWPRAKVVRLEDNYRSREAILELANQLIVHNSERHDKVLRASRGGGEAPRFLRFEDEASEAEAVVRDIRERLEVTDGPRTNPSDIAILFRTNEQPRLFEMELRRARIRYVLIGGLSFYDRKEVRDILSYLRVLVNPNDEVSLLRIINTPVRGIGTATIQTLLDVAVSRGQPLWTLLTEAHAAGPIPDFVVERLEVFRKLIEGFRARLASEKLVDLVTSLVGTIDYKSELERIYKTPGEVTARWEAVEELINAVAQYEQREAEPSLLGFLEQTVLDGRDDQRDDQHDKRREQALTLMTLHSAKGLEFPHVYMVGMEEGLLPHRRSVADGSLNIAEERRLCYVGVTRAMDTLTLTFCKSRMKWGKARPSIPSRFLMEMRGETERAKRAAEAAAELFTRELAEAAPGKGSRSRTRAGKQTNKRERGPRRRSAP